MQSRRKIDIDVEIEPPKSINSQIAEKIVFLNPERKAIENYAILGEVIIDKSDDFIIVEKPVFEIRVQTLEAGRGRLLSKRQIIPTPARLNEPWWYAHARTRDGKA